MRANRLTARTGRRPAPQVARRTRDGRPSLRHERRIVSFTRSVVCFWRPAMTCQRRSTWLVATAMKAIWRMHAGVQRLMSLITRRTRHQGRHPSPDSLAVSATMRHHGFILSRKPQLPLGHLLAVARNALRMPQREFGPALGVSHRTASRWDTGRSAPSEPQLRRLAALLVPVDRSLAEEAAPSACCAPSTARQAPRHDERPRRRRRLRRRRGQRRLTARPPPGPPRRLPARPRARPLRRRGGEGSRARGERYLALGSRFIHTPYTAADVSVPENHDAS